MEFTLFLLLLLFIGVSPSLIMFACMHDGDGMDGSVRMWDEMIGGFGEGGTIASERFQHRCVSSSVSGNGA